MRLNFIIMAVCRSYLSSSLSAQGDTIIIHIFSLSNHSTVRDIIISVIYTLMYCYMIVYIECITLF